MLIITILAIAALAIALVVGVTNIKLLDKNETLRTQDDNLKKQLRLHDAANKDTKAFYDVRRIDDKGEERVFDGNWAVCRISFQDLMVVTTVIKVFTDADDDFNHREATELCDKLNEK